MMIGDAARSGVASDPLGNQLKPSMSGHVRVEQEQRERSPVPWPLANGRERAPAAVDHAPGRMRPVAGISSRMRPVGRVVVDDEHPQALERCRRRPGGAVARGERESAREAERAAPARARSRPRCRRPSCSTSCAQIASPRPVPPYSACVEPSAWLKASKIALCLLRRECRCPVSRTAN